MFPKTIGSLPSLNTPTIASVVQDGPNYYITYSLGVIQSFYDVTVDFLVADAVVATTTLNPQAPTSYNGATQAFGTYSQGAEVKVRVTSLGQTFTSAAFTTTYAAFSGSFSGINLTSLPNAYSDPSPTRYHWSADIPSMLASAGYYNENIAFLWEWEVSPSTPPYTFNQTINKGWPVTAGDQFYGTDEGDGYLTPHTGSSQTFRLTITVSAAGYSTQYVHSPFSNV